MPPASLMQMIGTPKRSDEREFSFSEKEFSLLAEIASGRTGIVLAKHKKDMVYSRLVRRLRALKLNSFKEYCDLVQSEEGADEVGNLVNAITTNLTSFFRERHHFQHLCDSVLAPLAENRSTAFSLRIWSAGCSAGMEPYSIAMSVKSTIKNLKDWDARILATDIDTNMLNTAIQGEYAVEQLKNIPQEYLQYVNQADSDHIGMSEELKSLIAFRHLNLLESWPMRGEFDAVFCRNVVIYFDKPTQKKLFDRIANLIKPNGWLYIGHSENLFNICNRFKLMGRTVYQKVG